MSTRMGANGLLNRLDGARRYRNVGAHLLRCLLPDDFRPDQLSWLIWPTAQTSIVGVRRNEAIIVRVRILAAIFSALTLAWIPIDAYYLPVRIAAMSAVARLGAGMAFAWLACSTRRAPSIGAVCSSLGLLYAVPTVFYFGSLYLLQQADPGTSTGIALGAYRILPIVAMAGLGLFPLTVSEAVVFAAPIIVGEIVAIMLHLATYLPGTDVDACWLLFLMAGVATAAGTSQLAITIALVGRILRDPLTDCYSRAGLDEILTQYFLASLRRDTPLAVAFIDLNKFKSINDEFGHEVGDKVLAGVARRLRTGLRSGDYVGRWGGDEFMIVMPNTSQKDAIHRVERACARGFGVRPDGAPVTASVGVAERREDRCRDWKSLVALADRRMYSGKGGKRSRVVDLVPQNIDFG